MLANFKEPIISQIPVLPPLQQVDYSYLSPVARQGKFRQVLLEGIRLGNFTRGLGGPQSSDLLPET